MLVTSLLSWGGRRHCERSEAIQPHRRSKLGCFVASLLAMTAFAGPTKKPPPLPPQRPRPTSPEATRGERLMLLALIQILLILLTVAWWIIVIQMVLSWLVAFNVINTHNDFVRGLMRGLDRILEPIYRPIRKVLPDFGGLDFSPMVVIILLLILRKLLEGVGRDML
jgi:YggT family protein